LCLAFAHHHNLERKSCINNSSTTSYYKLNRKGANKVTDLGTELIVATWLVCIGGRRLLGYQSNSVMAGSLGCTRPLLQSQAWILAMKKRRASCIFQLVPYFPLFFSPTVYLATVHAHASECRNRGCSAVNSGPSRRWQPRAEGKGHQPTECIAIHVHHVHYYYKDHIYRYIGPVWHSLFSASSQI
jgi:hypothetical protein